MPKIERAYQLHTPAMRQSPLLKRRLANAKLLDEKIAHSDMYLVARQRSL